MPIQRPICFSQRGGFNLPPPFLVVISVRDKTSHPRLVHKLTVFQILPEVNKYVIIHQMPEITTGPDRSLLKDIASIDLDVQLGSVSVSEISLIPQYVEAFGRYWTSELKSGDPPCEIVLKPLFTTHDNLAEFAQVDVLLRANGDMSLEDLEQAAGVIKQSYARISEEKTQARMRNRQPVLKVEV